MRGLARQRWSKCNPQFSQSVYQIHSSAMKEESCNHYANMVMRARTIHEHHLSMLAAQTCEIVIVALR